MGIQKAVKYYTFYQNNSGGRFYTDDKLKEYVVIQAPPPDAEYANFLAERLGIYFGGVDSGRDCACCGNRWYRTNERDGHETPHIYSYPVNVPKSSGSKIVRGMAKDVHKDLDMFNRQYIVYPMGTIA